MHLLESFTVFSARLTVAVMKLIGGLYQCLAVQIHKLQQLSMIIVYMAENVLDLVLNSYQLIYLSVDTLLVMDQRHCTVTDPVVNAGGGSAPGRLRRCGRDLGDKPFLTFKQPVYLTVDTTVATEKFLCSA